MIKLEIGMELIINRIKETEYPDKPVYIIIEIYRDMITAKRKITTKNYVDYIDTWEPQINFVLEQIESGNITIMNQYGCEIYQFYNFEVEQ